MKKAHAMALSIAVVLGSLWGGSWLLMATAAPPTTQPAAADKAAHEGVVSVGRLSYAGGRIGKCFAAEFLEALANETHIRLQRTFVPVPMGSEALFQFPFVVMTGNGSFTLSPAERANLKAYLNRGGFLLASAGCSDLAWAQSFRTEIAKVLPDAKLQKLSLQHPIFKSGPFVVNAILTSRDTAEPAIYGLEVGSRLAVVFSPVGLNDTANAGGGCCCCGGNEVRNARDINADILAYALTH